ncbi:unnamed protein product [Tuber aestivum]|uniref:Uncharacterized protein n=1 Tax=Tuber aestivum TaxID=59557 RepID=A0A292PTA0_9PEZI|nr:unnamed protein product [Tuber aestivum]
MFRLATKRAFGPVSICRCYPNAYYASRATGTTPKKSNNPKHKTTCSGAPTGGDTTSTEKKRTTNSKYWTAYSRVSMLDAEKRLRLIFREFERSTISTSQMLAQVKSDIKGLQDDQLQQAKEEVFNNMVGFIEVEGYPTELDEDFKVANINDLVLLTIFPILLAFRRETGYQLELLREKEIIFTDSETGGYEEFVGMDFIGIGNRRLVFVVEAMRSSIGQAKKQCLLALKDMGESNGGGPVYGFVTTGEQWQMIRYDRGVFTQTSRFQVLLDGMEHKKEQWMREASIIVDCIHEVFRSGGSLAPSPLPEPGSTAMETDEKKAEERREDAKPRSEQAKAIVATTTLEDIH